MSILARSALFTRSSRSPLFWSLALLAVLGFEGRAEASTLVTGSSWPTINIIFTPDGPDPFNSGAGSMNVSYLDGNALPYLYCVDIQTNINAPGTYNTVDVTLDGKIRGNYVGGSAAVAGQIAWLLNNYGPLAVTQAQQGGLQAAIWKVEYGADFTLTASNDASTIAMYNTALGALGSNSAPLDSVLWISPWADSDRTIPAQGVITSAPVPEPSTILSALAGGLGLIAVVRRKRPAR